MNVRFAASFACGLALAAGCGSSSTGEDIAPIVDSLSRDKSPLAGGAEVIVYGEGFVFNAATPNRVLFGDRMAMFVETISDSELRVITPPQTEPGPVDIIVYNSNGFSTLGGSFSYNPLPTVTSISPERGTTAGGTTVTITGTGFSENDAGDSEVWLGDVEVQEVTVVNDTTIEIVTPPGKLLSAPDVVVGNENGTAVLSPGFRYRPSGILGITTNSSSPNWGFFWDAEADTITSLPRELRGGGGSQRITAAVVDPATETTFIAYADFNVNATLLGKINATGVIEPIGQVGPYTRISGLTIDAEGTIWAVSKRERLIGTVNKETGLITPVNEEFRAEQDNAGGYGVAFHEGTLYNTREGLLFTVDVATGAPEPDPVTIDGLSRVNAATSFAGSLYLNNRNNGSGLYIVDDPAAGTVTQVLSWPEYCDAIVSFE